MSRVRSIFWKDIYLKMFIDMKNLIRKRTKKYSKKFIKHQKIKKYLTNSICHISSSILKVQNN